MKSSKEKIASSQLVTMVATTILGASMTIGYVTTMAQNNTWFVLFTAVVWTAGFVLLYLKITQLFPGQNLLQIFDAIYGPIGGKIISSVYLLYFSSITILNFRYADDFVRSELLPETPQIFILLLLLLVCSQAVYYGLEVIARTSLIYTFLNYVVVIVTILLLTDQMDWQNLLPFMQIGAIDFIQSVHVMAIIPFGEIIVFLMFLPAVNQPQQVPRSMFAGLFLGGLLFVLVSLRNTTVLGALEPYSTLPSYLAVRLIDIGDVFTRLEILVGIMILITIKFKISLMYYAVVSGLSQMLSLRSPNPIILPLGILFISLAYLVTDFSLELQEAGITAWPAVASFVLYLLPILSFLIAKIRKKKPSKKPQKKHMNRR